MDGDVYEGKATVSVEHLTGEATPLEKHPGDTIPGGARNLDGLMIVKVLVPLLQHFLGIKIHHTCSSDAILMNIQQKDLSCPDYMPSYVHTFLCSYLYTPLCFRQQRLGRNRQWLE